VRTIHNVRLPSSVRFAVQASVEISSSPELPTSTTIGHSGQNSCKALAFMVAAFGADRALLPRRALDAVTTTRFEVVPLTKHIGAEICGIDLRDRLDADTVSAIHQAWLDHLVLVFRDQHFSQEDLVRATAHFGEIGPLLWPPKYFPKGYSKLLPNVMMISNIRENGETIGSLPDGEMNFHHDNIHSDMPHNGTLLYSVEIPSRGGDTLFASGYAAYDTLDPAIRSRLEGCKAVNHYNYGTQIRGNTSTTVEAFHEAIQPVFRTHDETGKKAVYVDRLMTMHIIDMPREESDQLLGAVFDHSEKPEFLYRHVWRVGDLLVWDNRCSSHAREDFPSDQRRLLFRTTVKGTVRPY
jgi:taurine dioxygenase